MNKYDVLIIGCGPAGIGASLVLKEAGINFAIIEGGAPGGKVNIAPRVDNYPGFTKIPGPDLAMALYKRVVDNNIEMISSTVNKLTKEGDIFFLDTTSGIYEAKYVIMGSGTTERKIGLEKEDTLLGHGISYCAICDGHFFRGKRVIVIGGGNSALKEAIYLSKIVKELTLIHRRDQFRGNDKLVTELKENSNVTVLTPYIPLEILGDDHVTGIRIQNKTTLEEKVIELDGIFPLVGQIPNTQYIAIDGVKDEWNSVPIDANRETKCSNLFACGDITPREIKQIYLSEFDGKVAAKEVVKRIKGDK